LERQWAWRTAFALADKIGSRPVSCEVRDVDRYKRLVAVCRLDGEDLNGWMVRQGWALADVRYFRDYEGEEQEAREERRGVWAGRVRAPVGMAAWDPVGARPLRRADAGPASACSASLLTFCVVGSLTSVPGGPTMRTVAAVLVTLLTLGPADALDSTETAAIQSAIRDQIEAFSRGDFVAAYARAAPGIQIQYQSPATFARLVQESYPALFQPRSHTFDAVRVQRQFP